MLRYLFLPWKRIWLWMNGVRIVWDQRVSWTWQEYADCVDAVYTCVRSPDQHEFHMTAMDLSGDDIIHPPH